jgi:hypothetical protein
MLPERSTDRAGNLFKWRFAGFVLSRRSKKVTDKDTNVTHIRRTKKWISDLEEHVSGFCQD